MRTRRLTIEVEGSDAVDELAALEEATSATLERVFERPSAAYGTALHRTLEAVAGEQLIEDESSLRALEQLQMVEAAGTPRLTAAGAAFLDQLGPCPPPRR